MQRAESSIDVRTLCLDHCWAFDLHVSHAKHRAAIKYLTSVVRMDLYAAVSVLMISQVKVL